MAWLWKVEYSREAANYLDDNGELVTGLFLKVAGLTETQGIPPEGAHQEEPGVLWWMVEQHLVIYRRSESERLIRILVIKPN